MNYFEKRLATIRKKEHNKIIHQFNKCAQIILQFEMLYFDAWCEDVSAIKTGLPSFIYLNDLDFLNSLSLLFTGSWPAL